MKSILIILFSFTALSAFSQKVEIKLVNKTGYNVTDLRFDGNELGTLKKNDFVILKTRKLEMYLNIPLEPIIGTIKGIKIEYVNGAVSNSDVSTVVHGMYIFDIVLTEHTFPFKGYTLDLKSHSK